MAPISRPLLPPKAGYVEVIDENGNHVYKPTPETEEKLKQQEDLTETQSKVNSMLGEQTEGPQAALEFNKAVQLFAVSIEDEATMMSIPSVYPEYKIGVAYKTKDKFRYGTNSVGDPQLYQVLQPHTSAAEFPPETSTSLYKKIGVSADGTPLWVQPLGATDAYHTGDTVLHNDKKWVSDIDNNVWEPGVYGWSEVDETTEPDPEPEPEPEEPSGDDVPDFVQPTGAHDAYNTGDRVRFTDGHVYESLVDNNVWSPADYPSAWQLVE